jgi:hypothetical protein
MHGKHALVKLPVRHACRRVRRKGRKRPLGEETCRGRKAYARGRKNEKGTYRGERRGRPLH